MTKTRTIKNDKYELQNYLRELKLSEAKEVIKVKLHMTKIPSNFKKSCTSVRFPLCDADESNTEHFFQPTKVAEIANIWNIKEEDIQSDDIKKLVNVAKFMGKVEELVQPKWSM